MSNVHTLDLSSYGITVKNVTRNPSTPCCYEDAIVREKAAISSVGALINFSGEKTGRSPKDKRVVDTPGTSADIWWGPVNIKLTDDVFLKCRERAVAFLNTLEHLYVVDGYAGWDPKNRIKVRVICARAYHALFMMNMLVRPTEEQLSDFGKPDYVIFNAGQQYADPELPGVGSKTCVSLNFERAEFVILGTQYAGEMKKGVFTIMNYLMPKKGLVSMHCSANEGESGDVSVFFGLSGTGKTTLSTEPHRKLIGDDEHIWTEDGIVNIEGGCYAKC
ncbi:MAG: phosphoenolpyruvate carboxykinase (ATP), partial [Thermoguttaceae bacterium]